MEQRWVETIHPLQSNQREKLYFRQKIKEMKRDWDDRREEQLQALRLRLDKLRERLGKLTDVFIDGSIEKELFEERKVALLMERRDLEEKLSNLKQKYNTIPDRVAEFLELAGTACLSHKFKLLEEKRDLMKIATSNRLVDRKNVEFTLSFPFQEVVNRFKNENGTPYRDIPRTWDKVIRKLIEHFELNPAPIIKGEIIRDAA